jgi:hypothetical protein
MSWFSKKLKKITKVVDPIGAKLRKSTGGSYGDPMNWYQSKPKAVTPYQRPEKQGLLADPGTGGPTTHLGSSAGYTQNPFAGQMAQADALRRGPAPTGANVAMPGISNMGSPMGGGMMGQPQVGMAPPQQAQMQPQGNPTNMMMRPGGRPPGMMF